MYVFLAKMREFLSGFLLWSVYLYDLRPLEIYKSTESPASVNLQFPQLVLAYSSFSSSYFVYKSPVFWTKRTKDGPKNQHINWPIRNIQTKINYHKHYSFNGVFFFSYIFFK